MDDNEKQLENEFLALCSTIGEQIKLKVALAEKNLAEAVELADKHGIPFDSGVSEISQSYVPPLFGERFGTLDKETVASLLNMSQWDLDHNNGWERSAIC